MRLEFYSPAAARLGGAVPKTAQRFASRERKPRLGIAAPRFHPPSLDPDRKLGETGRGDRRIAAKRARLGEDDAEE